VAAPKPPAPADQQTDGPDPFSEPTSEPARAARTDVERRRQQRVIAAVVIGAIVAVFAVINLNDVKVHWLVTTDQTPLIVVIVLAFLLGMVADRLLLARAKRKREPRS
jgi:uncharacterized integral membrane protein